MINCFAEDVTRGLALVRTLTRGLLSLGIKETLATVCALDPICGSQALAVYHEKSLSMASFSYLHRPQGQGTWICDVGSWIYGTNWEWELLLFGRRYFQIRCSVDVDIWEMILGNREFPLRPNFALVPVPSPQRCQLAGHNAHLKPRERLRRLRRRIWPPKDASLDVLRYVEIFSNFPTFLIFFFSVKGHVLCASCCTSIVEKTSSRLSPACPFCREPFTRDSLRIIRMDFTTSGWSTPHRVPAISTASEFNKVLFDQTTGSLLNFTNPKAGLNVRRLEERVARVAAKKCSVEEVSALYKELEEWIVAEKDERVRNNDSISKTQY